MASDGVKDVKIIKSSIHIVLETVRQLFDADTCALFLICHEMDKDEKLEIFDERLVDIKAKYKEWGKESEFPHEIEERSIDNFEVLKFIDVAEKTKRWNYGYEEKSRPCKYVIFKNFKRGGSILHEGLTAFIVRSGKDGFFESKTKIDNFPSTAHLNTVKRPIHPQCSMLIGLVLRDIETGAPDGVLKIENYSENPEKKRLFTASYAESTAEIKETRGYLPFLARLIKLSKSFYQRQSYQALFGGIQALERLKDLKVEGEKNRAIQEDTKHLFYIMKRYEHVGYEEIMDRVIYYANKVSETLNVANSFSFKHHLEKFKQHEELMLYELEEYRDHFMHQFHVFVMGYIILNKIGLSVVTDLVNKSLPVDKSQILFGIATPITEENTLRIWFLTSFFHDFAYILQEFDKGMSKFLHEMLGYRFRVRLDWSQLLAKGSPFPANLKHLVRFFQCQGKIDPVELLPDFLHAIRSEIDHGVVGALLLMENFGRGAHAERLRDCHIAAVSICLHNENMYSRPKEDAKEGITFETFPFAHLLAFCDTAQSWGRTARLRENGQPYVQPILHDIEFADSEKHITCKVLYKSPIQDEIPTADDLILWANRRHHFFRSKNYRFVIEYLKKVDGQIMQLHPLTFEQDV